MTSHATLPRQASTTATQDSIDARFDQRLALVDQAIDLHHTHIQDYLHSMTHNWHDAQDIAQELWRHVLLHFPEEKISQMGILRRKAYQLFVDHYRKRRRRSETGLESLAGYEPVAKPTEIHSPEEEARLQAKFWSELPGLTLTDLQKDCLWRHCRFSYTYQEISAQLGIPKSTVADWVSIARTQVKDHFNR